MIASDKPAGLFITYDEVLEPIGQSQVLAYLEELSPYNRIYLVSYEKAGLEALDSPHDSDALKRRAADSALEGVTEKYKRLLFPHGSALPRTAARSENRLCAE
jgi:hypothetical protein